MDVIQIEMIHKRQNENIAVFSPRWFIPVVFRSRGLFLDLFRVITTRINICRRMPVNVGGGRIRDNCIGHEPVDGGGKR